MLVGRLASFHAARTPKALAVVDGRLRLTYADLNRRVNRAANAALALGLRAGDLAALLMRNRVEFLEVYLALAKIGVTAVALNFRLASREVAYALNDSRSKALFYEAEFAPVVLPVVNQLQQVRHLVTVGASPTEGHEEYEALLGLASEAEPSELPLHHDQTQMIMYTSGTTGFPRGAMLSHANLFWSSFNVQHYHPVRPGDRCLCVLPLYHTAALHTSVFPHLHAGATVVIQRSYDLEEVLRLLIEERCTSTVLLPQMWESLSEMPLEGRHWALRELIVGGGPTDPGAVARLMAATGGRYSLIMGMTEAGPQVNFLPTEDVVRKNGTIGKPTLYARVRVVDDRLQDVPIGVVGEMVLQGPTVFSGYWANEEANREAFAGGWFHTGDLVRQDEEGFLTIVDRKKDMIRSGGENIYCLEVEQVLNRHPAVRESAVIGIPDERWGESVKAYIVAREGQHVTEDELIQWCRAHLASYKKPRVVAFVGALPRNATGKILRLELRRMHREEGI